MKTWRISDAEARFDELLVACLSEGPQTIVRHGADLAVLVDAQRWRQACAVAGNPCLRDLLLSDAARTNRLVPRRRSTRRKRSPRPL